ncbi:hypothetical protein BWZ22_13495 [Seonamhaeicola sp. S2-3]|uniref:hypothetical protein n=1 Tax=Seonamhaeicola sp. S2-3 TaxID=1936081 RepID=UPI0009728365|nr:hypothetical protein [Seonamhaeicola sp. S2-3]APY12161.1 hypothetical protein BWZ22_13420 [Seonamhaeicola sp. S2-3]APY12176.1 hypothetical protein BWZ22_13495 [Seonamhaeicola sp. S2-3]
MKLKELSNYTDRELLEITLVNQAKIEKNIYKIYSFLSHKYGNDFIKNNIHLDEALQNIVDDFDELNRQIRDSKSYD